MRQAPVGASIVMEMNGQADTDAIRVGKLLSVAQKETLRVRRSPWRRPRPIPDGFHVSEPVPPPPLHPHVESRSAAASPRPPGQFVWPLCGGSREPGRERGPSLGPESASHPFRM
ncbi:hypothetical protein DPEC_G00156060 [Dallia pectoralis]|uniref:Uncharacterized protein n=1 Tax=Dallia pectoralis TaxID=75939 RepID=A0ACC2GKY5_DALPE|nr:hypothetical protein DPEC_G00156060 [Dallia pectoralis]